MIITLKPAGSKTNVSMFKFINSKGRQVTNQSDDKLRAFGGSQSSLLTMGDCYDVLRPPRYEPSNHQFFKKRVSAIDKIQEELREMKYREDELR